MNDKKDNVYRPKSTGLALAAMLLILVVAVLIVAVAVFASGKNTTSDKSAENTSSTVKSDKDEQNNDNLQTTTPEAGDNPSDPSTGNTDPNIPSVAKASIPTSEVYKGSLLQIDESNSYKMSADLLLSRTEMGKLTADALLKTYNFKNVYGTTGGNYKVKGYTGYYLNVEALDALNKMMAAFVQEQGKKDVQLRNAYYYDAKSAVCLNATGYVVDLEVYNEKGLYSLSHASMRATYYNWFISNCAKYGFIHTGNGKSSTGEDSYSTFRYVGEAHASYITNNNMNLAAYLEFIKDYRFENRLVTTSQSGDEWWVYYVPGTGSTTEFNIVGSSYSISGNNSDGFVVAINASSFKDQ